MQVKNHRYISTELKSNPGTYLHRHHIRPKQMPRHGALLSQSIRRIRCSSQGMGTETNGSENMAEHQNFHLHRVQKRKQAEQILTKNFKGNMIKEQAKATEELITALTEDHTRQMETLIKSTTNIMKEMMSLIKHEQKALKNQPNNEKKKK
jgi:hypothetical protein